MKLVIVRHAEYGSGDHITERASEGLLQLAEKLKTDIDNPEIRTSPITRAKETAEVLREVLGGELIEDKDLVANYLRDGDYLTPEKARAYLSNIYSQPSTVILVTHIDICGLFLDILNDQRF